MVLTFEKLKNILIENSYDVQDISNDINNETIEIANKLDILPEFYKNVNKDLSKLDNSSLRNHYNKHGKYEKNRISKFQYFNKYFYLYLYIDLQNKSQEYTFLYNHYCRFGNIENRRVSIGSYNLHSLTNKGPIIDNEYLKNFICKFGFEQYEEKYSISLHMNDNVLPILFYGDVYNFQNYFIENNSLLDNCQFLYDTFYDIFTNIKDKDWKYLIYTNEKFYIKDILFSNNRNIVYNIDKVDNPYVIITNLKNNSNNYITTHKRHFIPSLKFCKVNVPLLNDSTQAYILTINNEKYRNFEKRAKNINMHFIKFMGVNKSILKNIQINRNLGHVCCLLGHYLILKKYYSGNNILIMEDDNDFVEDFNDKWNKIKSYLDSNLNEWDIFNGNLVLPGYVSKCTNINDSLNIINFTNNSKTNFIYYNKSIIPKFMKNVENIIFQINSNNQDWIIDRFFNIFNLVTSVPFITKEVDDNVSEIDNCVSNYNSLTTNCEKQLLDIINYETNKMNEEYKNNIYLLVHFYNKDFKDEFIEKINTFISINSSYKINIIMNLVKDSSCHLKDCMIDNINNINVNIIENVSDQYSLLLMLKNLNVNENDLIIYIHTKTNKVIRDDLMRILSVKFNDRILNNDAFFTGKYISLCHRKDVKEQHNFHYLKEICDITGKQYTERFEYYPITFFAYKAKYIDCIFKNVDKLINMCSFKDKECNNWLNLMNDENNYNIYNIKKINYTNNYFSTMINKGEKGIPNGCFEHGIERFIGGILLKDVNHVYNFF